MDRQTDRRSFVLGTVGATAAASSAAAQSQEIRTAHIGVGSRGGSLLRQTLKQSNVRITAICDIDPQARDSALSAAASHNPKQVNDWRAVLDLKEIGRASCRERV